MTLLSDLLYRLRALLHRDSVEEELDAELRFHLEQQTEMYVRSGLSVEEAARRARLMFGGIDGVKEHCRDARGLARLETLWQDIRYGLRGLRRAPAFAAVVVGTIALGIGVNTAAFTIFNAYVLRPVPVQEPHSLFRFTWSNRAGRGHTFTWPEYEEFRRHNQVFAGVFANRNLVTRIDSRLVFGQLVTRDYFRVLGIPAALGRTLSSMDGTSETGAPPVAVLSHSGWTTLFESDPAIVGRRIRIQGVPVEVIGVAPAGFRGLGEQPIDFWAPLSLDLALGDGPDLFGVEHPERLAITGRLRPDVTESAARAALAVWARQITATRPDDEHATAAILVLQATAVPMVPGVLLAMLPVAAAFGLVLLIACANVTNMMITRAVSRQREIGIRLSLGAARSRLTQQFLTESLLLALPAAVGGFGIAYIVIRLAVTLLLTTMPAGLADIARHIAPFAPDVRVFGFSVIAAVASALLFGLAPALHVGRVNVARITSGDFVFDVRPTRLRSALLVVQVAGSVLLLVCAGLMLRGAVRLADMDTGMNTRGVLEIELRERSRSGVVSALASDPVVRNVAATSLPIPFDGTPPALSVASTGDAELLRASYRFVSPAYFDLFDIRLRAGRTFTEEEARAGAAVAIVSETTARRLWPDGDAVGQSMRVPLSDVRSGAQKPASESVQIIGTVRDVITGYSGGESAKTAVYFPISESQAGNAVLVRVTGAPDVARRSLDALLAGVDPGAAVRMHKIEDFVAFRAYPFRVAHWISAAIGILALLLTVSGMYGLLSYLVAQRAREIGIRLALGETVGGAAGLVLRQSLRLAAVGALAGSLLGLGVSRILASQLVMMDTFDPAVYGAAISLVLGACVCASFFPALKAARIDPAITLRQD